MYLFAPARKRPRDHRGIGSTSMVIPVALIFVGRPVIHSTSRSSRKMLPTVNSPFTCSISLEFSQPMISPVDLANPALSAAYSPWFAWLNQQLTSRSYFRIISAVRSVDPSSTTMYSRFGYPWFTIDRMVASRYSSPKYTAHEKREEEPSSPDARYARRAGVPLRTQRVRLSRYSSNRGNPSYPTTSDANALKPLINRSCQVIRGN